ncbi:hypothetical protein I4U23_017663 [Adineta vaga]|nr:hypothetical protein I4U23_017663 [Adineta vaga]
MKVLLSIFFFITVCLIQYSIEQTASETELASEVTEISTTTTPWWTRTFPIIPPRTVTAPPKRPTTTATKLSRVSDSVAIAVPLALFGVTILVGFGLIIYATITGGNGVFFLTRTNQDQTP